MGYVTRVPGTVIGAASHNSEYRDQVVSVFATTAARDAAITVPVRGMMVYCTVPGRMFVRGAAAWYEVGVADAVAQVRRYRGRRVAALAITNTLNTTTALAWDTEDDDPDGMAVPPWSTITPGDGAWAVTVWAELTLVLSAASTQPFVPPRLELAAGGVVQASASFRGDFTSTGTSSSRASCTLITPQPAGNTIGAQIVVGTAYTNVTSLNVTAGGIALVKVG